MLLIFVVDKAVVRLLNYDKDISSYLKFNLPSK